MYEAGNRKGIMMAPVLDSHSRVIMPVCLAFTTSSIIAILRPPGEQPTATIYSFRVGNTTSIPKAAFISTTLIAVNAIAACTWNLAIGL
ncbi:hypothetical protein NMY22_g7689 [Coprinellus aureogranulatus]|nr:hypothetical protein NMY22_g7689 [Coprinellus aureogranulatus]